MTFTFAAMVAWDPIGKQAVKNTSFQAFTTADTGFTTPLAITDPFGNAIPGNILNSGSQGVFPQFNQAANSAVVITDPAHTYAWTLNAVMQDASVAAYISTPGSATASQLSATYVPKWKASTAYLAGDKVLSPNGDVVSAIADHTSGSSFTAANWNLSPSYAPVAKNVRHSLTGVFYPEGFGTVTYGKGVTSAQAQANAAAIQAAIDAANNSGGVAANTAGGGTVVIRDVMECYTASAVSALTLYSGVHLRGIGPGGNVFSGTDAALPFRGSVLRLWSGANQDLIRTANFAALTGVASPSAYSTPNRFGIYDMVLDGNKAGNISGDVLKIYGQSYWLRNLVIQNAPARGVYTEFGSSAGYDNEAQFHDLRITDCVGDGWNFQGPHDSVITNVFSSRNGGSGFVVGLQSGSLLVTNMHNWGNQGYNFDLGGQDCSFVNCVSDGAGGPGKAGVRLTGQYVRWIGGSLYGTGKAGEVMVQIGDGTTALTATGHDFHTRWFNLAQGAVLIAYMSNVTLGYNVWRGMVNNGTNSRLFAGNGRAKIVGTQTIPAGTITVDSTAGFPTSGSLYSPGGTLSYTGTTSTTFTGVTGGVSSTLTDQTYILQAFTGSYSSETFDFRSADGNTSLALQMGATSSTKMVENTQRDQIGAMTMRSVATQTQTLASSGAVTFDASQGNSSVVTLQANATSSTIVNQTSNQEITITWVQDATGGRTYAWPTNCKFAAGSAPSDTTASKRTSARFRYDGASASWWETARSVAVG